MTPQIQKRVKALGLAFVLCIPALLTLPWLLLNHRLPTGDGSNFIETAFHLYRNFGEQTLGSALLSCYKFRGWRTISFPLLLVPFLAVSGGSLLFATRAVALLCLVLSSVYSYCFARLQVQRGQAVAIAILVSAIPSYIALCVDLFAESALVAGCLAGLYHLVRSDGFQSRRHSLWTAVWMAFAWTIRPIECVMTLAPALIVAMALAARARRIEWRAVALAMTILTAASAAIVVVPALRQPIATFFVHPDLTLDKIHMEQAYRLLIAASVIAFAASLLVTLILYRWSWRALVTSRHAQNNSNLWLGCGVLAALLFDWWAPFFQRLFEWVYATSLGHMIRQYPVDVYPDLSSRLRDYASTIGGVPIVYAVLALALFGIVCGIRNQQRTGRLPVLLTTAPIPLFTVFASGQPITRRLAVAIACLLLAALGLALQKGRLERLRTALVVALLGFQLLGFSWTNSLRPGGFFADQADRIDLALHQFGADYRIPPPALADPDYNEQFVSALEALCAKYRWSKVSLILNGELSRAITPILLERDRVAVVADFAYFQNLPSDLAAAYKSLGYEALFISNSARGDKNEQRKIWQSWLDPKNKVLELRITALILLALDQGQSLPGLQLVDEMHLGPGADIYAFKL